MPISVLLIQDDRGHADAVVRALVDPWLGWQVAVVPTLHEARRVLSESPTDVILATRTLPDGPAFDLLTWAEGVPALILVPPGTEAHAALAMRHGFADFVVQDDAYEYLLTLPAQIEAVLERSSSARARREAQRVLARQHALLQAISQAQARFITQSSPREAFGTLLGALLDLTNSAVGAVGEVVHTGDGRRQLCLHAVLDQRWDAATRDRYAAELERGLLFDDPHSLVGAALGADAPQIRDQTSDGAATSGAYFLDRAAAPVDNFLGMPIHAAGELVALVGLAHRPGGYTMADVQFLEPLLNTVGQMEMARRAETARGEAQAALATTSALLAEKTHALQVTLASVSQGITNVDASGRIQVYNQRYLELLDLPESLLASRPMVEEVVRFQTERGDFGEGFELIESSARNYVAQEYAAHGGQLPMPDVYVRRTRSGRFIEVRTRALPQGGRVRTFTDVTAYLGTVEALRQSEARWRSLTQLSSDWYWEQDAQLRFVRLDGNPHPETGLPDEHYYGLRRWELPNTYVPEGQWNEHRAQLEAREVFQDFEMQRVTPSGATAWISISGEPIFNAEGAFTGYRGVARDITERKRAEAEIERLAFYDELTSLPNRRLLLDRLERAVIASTREGHHGALLFLDLDNFKGINDTMGHDWGDRLLVQVARRLSASVRASDTVARIGGDEFVIILQRLHASAAQAVVEAETVGQKILQALNQPYPIEPHELHSTPSIGVALFRGSEQPIPELLKRADLAMYQAKAQGRNMMCFFDPAMQAAATARSILEGDIRLGIQRGEFLMHYQPVVDAQGGILGAEALVRWNHPVRGMVSPAEFIPVAEQSGLILALGRRVLRLACEQLAAWAHKSNCEHWTVAVNVSAKEFRHPEYVPQVLAALQDTGVNPRRLKLELTESLLLHDVEECIVQMQTLRAVGVGFSLDDFGTGYSSLSYLKRLPLDQLKIDQSFVRDVLTDPNDAAIACTIVALAASLGLDVVAEGVETEGQRDFLLRNGCRRFQGYLFGRPVPADQWACD